MELIFGPGVREDLFAAKNGLFLHRAVEDALEKGVLTIVPDVILDTPDLFQPTLSLREVNHRRLKEWQKSEPKEFKFQFRILDPKDTSAKKVIYDKDIHDYPVETIAELHNRRLQFRGHARPGTSNSGESAVVREVKRVGEYWATMGPYMKSEHLRAIANLIKQNLEIGALASAASSIRSIREDPMAAMVILKEMVEGKVRGLDEDDEDDEGEWRKQNGGQCQDVAVASL
ncbi:hypothetical protein CONLIGDRAFT_686718 [Coniochaeta ligniaria NRRL 30616]|uniref:Uncharacterized protein n=1 Tax=Coniochaeta ligniaria NRRL 30616 TaxID=1408157 RepID=A0A1J7J087_9PEZI|nr:hypothetical protein CONLIGDRAFT_686718 [Coniochaeta ligniaria NRRL 30616]